MTAQPDLVEGLRTFDFNTRNPDFLLQNPEWKPPVSRWKKFLLILKGKQNGRY